MIEKKKEDETPAAVFCPLFLAFRNATPSRGLGGAYRANGAELHATVGCFALNGRSRAPPLVVARSGGGVMIACYHLRQSFYNGSYDTFSYIQIFLERLGKPVRGEDSQGFSGILQSVFKECSSISEPLRESQRIRANQMKEGKSKKRAVTVCVPVDRCTGAEVLKKTGKDNRKRTNCSFCCCCCKINRKFLKSFKKTRKNLKDSLDKSSQQITCRLTSTSGGQLAQLAQES